MGAGKAEGGMEEPAAGAGVGVGEGEGEVQAGVARLAAGSSVEREFAGVEVGVEAVVDLEAGDAIGGADRADLAADAGVEVAPSGGGGAKRQGWLGWLGWLGGLGVLGAGIALGVFYYATTPDTPEEAGERYIERHYDAIAEALVRTVLVSGGLPGELLAEVGESIAERVAPYSCELPELGDGSAGPEDVRCVLGFGLRKPVELVVEAPLNVRLDWKRRDVFGRRAPVGLSSEVVPAGVRVNVFRLESLPDLGGVLEPAGGVGEAVDLGGQVGAAVDDAAELLEGLEETAELLEELLSK